MHRPNIELILVILYLRWCVKKLTNPGFHTHTTSEQTGDITSRDSYIAETKTEKTKSLRWVHLFIRRPLEAKGLQTRLYIEKPNTHFKITIWNERTVLKKGGMKRYTLSWATYTFNPDNCDRPKATKKMWIHNHSAPLIRTPGTHDGDRPVISLLAKFKTDRGQLKVQSCDNGENWNNYKRIALLIFFSRQTTG